MTNNSLRKRTIIVTIVCIIYLLLTTFYYHIDKYTTGVPFILFTLLFAVTLIAIVVYFFKGLFQAFGTRFSLTFNHLIPTIICGITLGYTVFSPYRVNSEGFESKIIFRACFEGTQNQATLKFREDKTFEINWTGVFFYDSWYTGTYKQNADTFYLQYSSEKPYRFGDSILNNGQSLITLNKIKIDSSQYFVPFYLGDCKGLN